MAKIIFIGSSVCVGTGAHNDRGWSTLLAERLMSQGHEVSNCSIGGQKTSDILLRLERDVINHAPDICIVGLGLANEGLPKTGDELDARIIQGVFLSNLAAIVNALRRCGIRPVIGGVYPNNKYTPMHYGILKETQNILNTWDVKVFDWLNALDDGCGHFKDGLDHDAGHPNDAGYKVMYDCIPEKLF